MSCLEGLRILDLSRVLAGPFCTQLLGDLGAEIIKIEKPFAGDDTRQWGPPFLKDKDGNDSSESAYYLSANRNKKSLAIDIKTERGQILIRNLLEKADIFIHNFKVGGLEKYGLGYDRLKDKHPRLIYCAISGFGQNGPLAGEPGYDFLAQAMAGLMACTGGPDQEPTKAGVALGDIITGLYAAIGILAALHSREKTGKGQMVDLSLLDCTLSSLTNIAQYYLTSGTPAPRVGNAHATIVPYQAFPARDGYIVLAIGNNEQFRRFCALAGKPQWAEEERFATNAARVQNRETLVPLLAGIIKNREISYWLEKCRQSDVPCGPVNTMDKVFEESQIRARDMKIEMPHPLSPEPVALVGSPFKFSETPVSYTHPPPLLGEHTKEILENWLNLSADEIQSLHDEKIIQARPL